MPLKGYVYTVIDKNGKKHKNRIDAPDQEAVVAILKSKGYVVVSIKLETILNKEIQLGSDGKLRSKEIAVFSKQFSMLLKAGISISGALEILIEQVDSKQMAKIVDQIYEEVQRGTTLSIALRMTKKFPDLFVNTIESGESGGSIDDVVERMATYYEKTSKTASRVKSAMIYPTMILIVTTIVSYILIAKVVPTFEEMFSSFDAELPALTKFMMNVSEFLNNYGLWVIAGLVLLGVFLIKWVKTPTGRLQKDMILLKIPVVKNLVQKSAIARFSRTLSIMLKSGIPMLKSLDYSIGVLNNALLENSMISVRDEVSRGNNISAPIEKMRMFPKMVVSMAKIGEETGALDEMMSKCADFYDEEVEEATKRVMALIEPMTIVLIAGVVGTIVISIVQPMFGMYGAIM